MKKWLKKKLRVWLDIDQNVFDLLDSQRALTKKIGNINCKLHNLTMEVGRLKTKIHIAARPITTLYSTDDKTDPVASAIDHKKRQERVKTYSEKRCDQVKKEREILQKVRQEEMFRNVSPPTENLADITALESPLNPISPFSIYNREDEIPYQRHDSQDSHDSHDSGYHHSSGSDDYSSDVSNHANDSDSSNYDPGSSNDY